MKYIIALIVLLTCAHGVIAQMAAEDKAVIDSIRTLLKDPKVHDTTKAGAMSEAAEILYYYKQDTLMTISLRQKELVNDALKNHSNPKVVASLKKSLANALNNIGVAFGDMSQTKKALTSYFKSLNIHKEINDPEGKGSVVNNIAIAFENQGDVTRALEYYNQSLVIRDRAGDMAGKAISLFNIAYIYTNQNENEQALKYFFESLRIEDSLENDFGKAFCYNSIGEVYIRLSELNKGKTYLDSAFQIRKKVGDQLGMARTYENYADINLAQESYALALQNFKKAYNIRKDNGEPRDLCFNLFNTGLTFLKTNRIDSALYYAQLSENIAEEINYPSSLRNVAHLYSMIYEKKGEPEKALFHYKHYIFLRDSLQNAELQRATIQREAHYNFEKQLTEDSIRYANRALINDAMIDKQNAELKARRNQQYLLFGGLSLSIIFGLFVFNRFRVTRKQNKIIEIQRETSEMQRKVVEVKNKEITDSINYAKRIQQAILPPKQTLTENLVDGFVYFKPKDVVSGDFYWLEKANGHIFFAAADCTGHGVPGAMVSVVCSNALSKSVLEEEITDTGRLLDRTREIVIEQLNKSGETVNDGMDISVVAIKEKDRNLEKAEIQWSGANNGIWIIRAHTEELTSIKADKQPVGVHQQAKNFTSHTIEINKGDQIYLFTDGFVDQFGGEHLDSIPRGGKKYKSKRFKEFLLSIKDEDMDVQRELLNKEYEFWRGDLEQIDDVCVIGVRF